MNQILYEKNFKKRKKSINNFRFQLFISLFLAFSLILYWHYFYNDTGSEEISDSLLSSFNIERIYHNNNHNYTVVELNSNNSFVIGIIEIQKINIKYPILSTISDDLLKISVCRFYGPSPNETGNLCLAAHNFDDDRFFGKLYKLDIGDSINIYNLRNNLTSYTIYDKFESSKNDTSYISQYTDNKILTLVTCNNINKSRLIVKAKEIKKP